MLLVGRLLTFFERLPGHLLPRRAH
jgi:hypothetical protein